MKKRYWSGSMKQLVNSEYETDSKQEGDTNHDELDNVLVPKEESNLVESESESNKII